jgi:hypothetical protein
MYEGILVDVAFAGFFLAKVHACKSVVRQATLNVRAAVAWEAEEFLG